MTDAAAEPARVAAGPLSLAVLAVALAVGIAWAGRVSEGRSALAESTAALSRGDTAAAIQAARVAAQARCPTCDAPAFAFAQLETIAREAEGKADDTTAFAAWVAVRSASLATASLGPGPRRAQAEAELARLGRKIDATAALSGGAPSPAASEERLRAALATSGVPSGGTFALVGLGAVVFAAGAFRLARARSLRGTDAVLAVVGIGVAALALALF